MWQKLIFLLNEILKKKKTFIFHSSYEKYKADNKFDKKYLLVTRTT